MSTSPEDERTTALREQELARLFRLPQFPMERPADEVGVLLSDRIKHYCEKYEMITPFYDGRLSPAAYALSVGRHYYAQGKRGALDDGLLMEIGPYQVAVIETFETINLPNFLIGRWNVQVKKAYQGLLWVGGAQVDPGFRGHLCCPIYNLSSKAITLNFREKIAVIDFVTTTPYRHGDCKDFPWRKRSMLVFDDYIRSPLESGIAEQVEKFKTTLAENDKKTNAALKNAAALTERKVVDTHKRIDTFLTLIFTVVAVLFTGVGHRRDRESE